MISELKQLERVTGRGRDIVDHPVNLHDDAINAASGACVLVADFQTGPVPRVRSLFDGENEGGREAIKRGWNAWRA
jgi:hypothetical protein